MVRPTGDEVAMFLYTSGSTGKTKGVPLTHYGQLWVIKMRARAIPDFERHRLVVAAPLYHMNGLAISKSAMAGHASEVILPQFTVETYLKAVERFGCTWLTTVPTMAALITREIDLVAKTDLSSAELRDQGYRWHWGDNLLRPPFRFFRSYVLKMGFFEGPSGYFIAATAAIYVFLKYAKLRELELAGQKEGGCGGKQTTAKNSSS